jgi:hypothetical protein
VLHELGHVLGLEDDPFADSGSVMMPDLKPGERHLPTLADVDKVMDSGNWH